MPASSAAPCLFAPSESRGLAAAVARDSGIALAPLEERRFEGGEFKLRPLESVRGRTAFVLQCLAGTADLSVADRLLRLLFLLQVLRDGGAERMIALVPYLAFARKDRRTQIRDPVSSRYVAELLEATRMHRLIALDAHNPAALDNAFRVPVDHLTALPMMADHFTQLPSRANLAVASPDVGGIKRAQIFRERLAARLAHEVDLVFIEKRRALDVVSGGALVGDVAGKTVIVIDDLCATGGTLIRAAAACRRARAQAVHVAVTHAPSPSGLQALTGAPDIATVALTDSVGLPALLDPATCSGKLAVLSVAPLFGAAIRRMLAGRPVAPLLENWPVPLEG